MNAKLDKSLRRMAREQTVGAPEREYYRDRRGSTRLDRDCTQGRYRILKRAAHESGSLDGVSGPIYILDGPDSHGESVEAFG